jgi:hypothetical protein
VYAAHYCCITYFILPILLTVKLFIPGPAEYLRCTPLHTDYQRRIGGLHTLLHINDFTTRISDAVQHSFMMIERGYIYICVCVYTYALVCVCIYIHVQTFQLAASVSTRSEQSSMNRRQHACIFQDKKYKHSCIQV